MTVVSVVIPAYNARDTLGVALESVLSQTFRDREVIVVDDGSTDDTREVAEAFGSGVTCISRPNGGVSSARNAGIERAAGRYVAFLDADDRWAPDKLARQVALLDARSEVGLCFVGAKRVDGGMNVLERMPAVEHPDFTAALLLGSQVVTACSSSSVTRRELLVAIGGFDSRFSQCADWDFALRMSLRTRIAAIDEPLVLYRTAAGNMSSDIGLLERDTFGVLDRFYADGGGRYARIRRRVYSNHWMYVAGSYLHAGDSRAALRCAAQGLALYPLNASRMVPANWIRARLGGGRGAVSQPV